jgi:hypothetical protein
VSLPVVTEKAVAPAYVVEPYGLSSLVADGLVKAKRLLRVAERVGVAALMFGDQAEILVDIGLAEAVTQPLVQPEAAGVVAKSLIVVLQVVVGACQEAARDGLPGNVAGPGGGG